MVVDARTALCEESRKSIPLPVRGVLRRREQNGYLVRGKETANNRVISEPL